MSLDTWVDHICQIVDTASEPVVLVGHSRGGIIISEVAERRPEKIALLVYLAAFLLRDGESLLPVVQRDGTSLVLPNLVVSEDQTSSTIKPQAIRLGKCFIPTARTRMSRSGGCCSLQRHWRLR